MVLSNFTSGFARNVRQIKFTYAKSITAIPAGLMGRGERLQSRNTESFKVTR
jgi:hypothetical protein